VRCPHYACGFKRGRLTPCIHNALMSAMKSRRVREMSALLATLVSAATDSPWTRSGRVQAMSSDSPWPRTIHVLEQSTNTYWPRTGLGHGQSRASFSPRTWTVHVHDQSATLFSSQTTSIRVKFMSQTSDGLGQFTDTLRKGRELPANSPRP
jgi:hypothetical protein